MNSNHYLILLGKSEDLAFAELTSICARLKANPPEKIDHHLATINTTIKPETLLQMTGGIVKIYQSVAKDEDEAAQAIATDLIELGSTHFALSSTHHHPDLMSFGSAIKKILAVNSIKPHFRLLNDPYVSAGIITKSIEYCIVSIESQPVVWKTVAVQNLNYWTAKDFGRPQSDPRSGMMPPKIARMMINISLNEMPTPTTLIYDPFCGSGTTLMETLDLGASALGSDLSEKAIAISKANCDWFKHTYQPKGEYQLFVADATHLPVKIGDKSVDSIVFEGYLGSPHPDMSRIDNIIKGLEKMYTGVFKQLHPKLKKDGIIVCALPEFVIGKRVKNLDHLIDHAVKLGYTLSDRFSYSRPQAQVKRVIYVLHKVTR